MLDSQTQLKIKQEDKFRKELLILFNRVRKEYRVSVATGSPLRADLYEAQFKALLEAHYRRVQKAFRGQARVDVEDEDKVLAALMLWIRRTSTEAVGYIVGTTQRQMDKSLIDGRQALSDAGNTQITDRELAAIVAILLRRVFPNRASQIAVFETQRAAESTKLIEVYDSAGLDPANLVPGPLVAMLKIWNTMRDNRVRTAHVRAAGQTKPVNQPYIVKGQKLMYPGDTSLGATMDNVANCRCWSGYRKK